MRGYEYLYTASGRMKSWEEFFADFAEKSLQNMTHEQQQEIYARYCMRAQVLGRDGFVCQNAGCYSSVDLTVHHVRARRNGGPHDPRNGVTLCEACHSDFEKARRPLVFPDLPHLPKKLRGHTFRQHKPMRERDADRDHGLQDMMSRAKQIRRQCRFEGLRGTASWQQLRLLMQWLMRPYGE